MEDRTSVMQVRVTVLMVHLVKRRSRYYANSGNHLVVCMGPRLASVTGGTKFSLRITKNKHWKTHFKNLVPYFVA